MAEETKPTLAERVSQFQCMELPGQPMMMHMGTSYLVSDLWRSHQEMLETLREMVTASGGVGLDAKSRRKKAMDDAIAVIAKAEGRS